MITGHPNLEHAKTSPFSAPVYVYKNKVNSAGHAARNRGQTLPALPPKEPETPDPPLLGSEGPIGPTDPSEPTGEKFKSMLQQLDRMILDKHQEMEEEKGNKNEI